MGEYAMYHGEEVKIGTCEEMYYLRADQAHLVRTLSGNVDPMRDRLALRFRFPFPDEDGVPPGGAGFDPFERGITIPGVRPSLEIEHGTLQFTARPGYLLSIPCPEAHGTDDDGMGCTVAGLRIHRNGFSGGVHLVQQRYQADGSLACIFRCGSCGVKWRATTLADVEPYVAAVRSEADRVAREDASRAQWWHTIADRMLAGYTAAAE
jgi:hypothetical protein